MFQFDLEKLLKGSNYGIGQYYNFLIILLDREEVNEKVNAR